MIILCTIQSINRVWNEFDSYHQKNNFMTCRTWLNENLKADEKIALPVTYEGYFLENKNCLERIVKRISDSLLIATKLQTQILPEYKNKPLNVRAVILEDLFLDEKKYLDQKFRVKYDFVSTHPMDAKIFDIYYYTEKDFTSLHCFKYNETKNDSQIKYVLTENKTEPSLRLIKKFDAFRDMPFYLYLREKSQDQNKL